MNLHKGLNQLQILMKTFVVKKSYYPSSFIGTWFDQDNRQTRIRWMEVRSVLAHSNTSRKSVSSTISCRFNMCKCLHTCVCNVCCGGWQTSGMHLRGTTLIIHSQNFKAIICGWSESSDSVGPTCDVGHSLSIPPHHKPSDSISVIDFFGCRVPPRESDGGSSMIYYSYALWWSRRNWEKVEKGIS